MFYFEIFVVLLLVPQCSSFSFYTLHINQIACFPDEMKTSCDSDPQDQTKRLNCHFCSYVAKDPSYLKIHLRTHTGEKPYTCNLCSRSFSQTSNLKVHILSHTGERRFPCTLCGKSFTRNTTLRRHFLTHHYNISFPDQFT